MMEKDNSMSMAQAAISECKSAVQLNPSNQQTPGGYSGHSSAPYAGSVKQSAAVPSGSPGK